MSRELHDFLQTAPRPRLLVVGDVILDRYWWGSVERISPEAPIPLLRVNREEHRLGGAGSVTSMLAALEARVLLASVVGNDADGQTVKQLLQQLSLETAGVHIAVDRPTTVKQRFLGLAQNRHPQQMIRVDREEDRPLLPADREVLGEWIAQQIFAVDLVLISDYSKGVCADEMVPRIVDLCRQSGVRVVADPIREGDYSRYRGCTCITPNRWEASLASGITIRTPRDGLAAAERLLEYGIDSVIVTLDRDGMAWAARDGRRGLFPARPRQVYDITGAGDMVLSVIGWSLAGGLDYPQAIELANLAGGLEVERLGVMPLSRAEIAAELRPARPNEQSKVVSLDTLLAELDRRRAAGQRIAMTNGCFDLLHPGHVACLQAARQWGDCLIVGLNSDRSVRALKGNDRPIVAQADRAAMLAALECVDYVVLFDEASVERLVSRIRPDTLIKAAQYGTDQVVGHEVVESYGGQVRLAPMQPGYSTTELIQRIKSLEKPNS